MLRSEAWDAMTTEERGNGALRRAVWASTIGNALEWFDFTVFALFAGVIGEQFFPPGDKTSGLLAAYGALGVAYVARPLGALWFGSLADRIGRKRALVTVIVMMALGTGAIGLMPSYRSIGIAAPLGLFCARLLQGFSVGGDFGASTTLLFEFAPPSRRGFYASFQYVSQALAFLLASTFAATLTALMSPDDFRAWGWRVPFVAGLAIAPIGLYLRSRVDETPAFRALLARNEISGAPLRSAAAGHGLSLLALSLVTAGFAAFTAIGLAFLPYFAARELHLRLLDAQIGLMAVSFASIAMLLIGAALSDRFGRVAVMAPAVLLYVAISYFALAKLIAAPSRETLWIVQASGLVMALAMGPYCALATEIFPAAVRAASASIAYNFAVAIFGGFAPLALGVLTASSRNYAAPYLYFLACIALTLFGLGLMRSRSAA